MSRSALVLLSLVMASIVALIAIAVAPGNSNPTISRSTTPSTARHPVAAPVIEPAPHVAAGPGVGTAAHYCDNVIGAGTHTSCPFARRVFAAFADIYRRTHIAPAHVTAYSPVVGQTYSLDCEIARGDEAVCSTGTAVVSFFVSPY